MKNEIKNELKAILGKYDGRLLEEERAVAATRAAEEAFPARFATLRTETLRPVMQELVELLGTHGHSATVIEREESSTTVGGFSHAAISLRINPKLLAGKPPEGDKTFIEIAFAANRRERKVTVSSTNTAIHSSGNVGKRGEYLIEVLTADVVAEEVTRTLQEALQ
jgi:hypothetical protein